MMKKTTLEKIFEYASMPLHGTLSRKLRKDIGVQVNEEKIYTDAVLFLGEEFVRITGTESYPVVVCEDTYCNSKYNGRLSIDVEFYMLYHEK